MINHRHQSGGLRAVIGNLFVAALAVMAAGCDLSTGELTSVSINQFVQVRNPIGHVQGIVVDSNGRPLQGASVTIGSRQTTTNSGGSYEFRDLEVANVAGTNANNTATVHPALAIVITPNANTFAPIQSAAPTSIRYLGAIVRVSPAAQFNNSTGGASNQSTGNPTTEGDQTNGGSQTIFVDGFRIQALDAVLPELTVSVSGNLRNGMTGQAVPANTQLNLDFRDLAAATADEQASRTGDIQYQAASIRATTDASGNFTFSNVPANSTLNMTVSGFDLTACGADGNANTADGCPITTSNEETNPGLYAGSFTAMAVGDQGDRIAPTVASASGVFMEMATDAITSGSSCADSTTGDIGLLTRGVNGTGTGLQLNFTEALSPVADARNSVLVFNHTTGAYVTVTSASILSPSATRLSIVTPAIAEGQEFSIYFLNTDFGDLASNVVTHRTETTAAPNFPTQDSYEAGNNAPLATNKQADYSCLPTNVQPWSKSIQVSLHTFRAPTVQPGAAVVTQNTVDPRLAKGAGDLPVNQDRSVSFNDVLDGTAIGASPAAAVQQLQTDPADKTEQELESLARAFGEATANLDTNVARVSFPPVAGFNSYNVTLAPGGGSASTDNIIVGDATADFTTNVYTAQGADTLATFQVVTTRSGGNNVLIIGPGVSPGDVITIAALDDLGNPGTSTPLTLRDNVEPTVVLQRSYADLHDFAHGNTVLTGGATVEGARPVSGCFNHDPTGAAAAPDEDHAGVIGIVAVGSVGDGGELTADGTMGSSGDVCIGSSPEILANSAGAVSTTHADLERRRTTGFNVTANTTLAPRAYDRGAFTGWLATERARRMGVAFSENIGTTLTGTPTFTGGTTALTDFQSQPDTLDNHNVGGPRTPLVEDLVTMLVADPLNLANRDHGRRLNFTGVVADIATGNPATANTASADAKAVVAIRDQWPPYVIRAERTSNGNFIIVFNEDVIIVDGVSTVTLTADGTAGNTVTITFNVGAAGYSDVLNADGTETITVPGTGGTFGNVFGNASLRYTDANGPSTQHAVMDYRRICDVRGNCWENHTAYRSAASETGIAVFAGDSVPQFIVDDLLGSLTATDATTGFTNGGSSFTYSITLSHPIRNWLADQTMSGTFAAAMRVFDLTACNTQIAGCAQTGGVLGTSTVTFNGAFVEAVLDIETTAGAASTCVVNQATSTATIGPIATGSDPTRVLTFNVNCVTANSIVGGDKVFIDNSAAGTPSVINGSVQSSLTGESVGIDATSTNMTNGVTGRFRTAGN